MSIIFEMILEWVFELLEAFVKFLGCCLFEIVLDGISEIIWSKKSEQPAFNVSKETKEKEEFIKTLDFMEKKVIGIIHNYKNKHRWKIRSFKRRLAMIRLIHNSGRTQKASKKLKKLSLEVETFIATKSIFID